MREHTLVVLLVGRPRLFQVIMAYKTYYELKCIETILTKNIHILYVKISQRKILSLFYQYEYEILQLQSIVLNRN